MSRFAVTDDLVHAVEPSGGELFWGAATILVTALIVVAVAAALVRWRRRHAA